MAYRQADLRSSVQRLRDKDKDLQQAIHRATGRHLEKPSEYHHTPSPLFGSRNPKTGENMWSKEKKAESKKMDNSIKKLKDMRKPKSFSETVECFRKLQEAIPIRGNMTPAQLRELKLKSYIPAEHERGHGTAPGPWPAPLADHGKYSRFFQNKPAKSDEGPMSKKISKKFQRAKGKLKALRK